MSCSYSVFMRTICICILFGFMLDKKAVKNFEKILKKLKKSVDIYMTPRYNNQCR